LLLTYSKNIIAKFTNKIWNTTMGGREEGN
jgi:hypothetical protein